MFGKRKVDTFKVENILKEFLSIVIAGNRKIIIYPEVTKDGIVKIHTNIPGVLVGKGGETHNAIKYKMITEANAKDIEIVELKNFISNIENLY